MQGSIFKGAFLDPRSSAVHGVFIFLGCYFFAWIRATKPKLTLLSIFGTIILDSESFQAYITDSSDLFIRSLIPDGILRAANRAH